MDEAEIITLIKKQIKNIDEQKSYMTDATSRFAHQDYNYGLTWVLEQIEKSKLPKTVKKTFVIEYRGEFNVPLFIKQLSDSVLTDIMKVEEIPNIPPIDWNLGEPKEIPEKYEKMSSLAGVMLAKYKGPEEPEIKKECANCGWYIGYGFECKNPKDCIKYSEWKPIPTEKICENCGWHILNKCTNKKTCFYPRSEWKPIEPKETEEPEIVKTCYNCGRGDRECYKYLECNAQNLKDWIPEHTEKKENCLFKNGTHCNKLDILISMDQCDDCRFYAILNKEKTEP